MVSVSVGYRVHFCVSTCGAEGVNIVLRAMRVGTYACVYVCLSSTSMCQVGLRLRLTHHFSRPPPHHHALPVEDAAGALVISAPGQDARASAGPLSAVDWRAWPYWPCWAPIGGWGPLGLRAQGPVRPGVVGCRWSLRACRHGTLGPYTVAVGGPAFGLSSALSGWRPRLSLRWFSWGSRALGGLRMFGARVFSVPASCLAGWGCCSPHTLLNVYMEEPYEHKRAHTHRCTLKHSHWCKNRCSQTPIVLICCCFKTYFVI